MNELRYEWTSNDRELGEVLEVRRKVFVEEQGISPALDQDGYDSDALHVIVKDGDLVVGTLRTRFMDNKEVKLERMAILKPSREIGIGREIISFVENELKKRGVERITLHAQYAVIDFYKKCGFIEVGAPFIEADIKHITMIKDIN